MLALSSPITPFDPTRTFIGDGSLRPAVLVLLAVIFTMYAYRRRRVRQSHLAYVQQAQQGSGSAYGPYGSPGGPPPFSPQYPPPTHNGLNSPYFYDPTTGFAPVRDISVLTSDFSDAPLDALALAAFYVTAAVLSATTWRAPDQISEVKRRLGTKYLLESGPMLFFTLLSRGVVFSWKPVGRQVTINLSQCYL